jgi:sortase (surface protein transpeptidase)
MATKNEKQEEGKEQMNKNKTSPAGNDKNPDPQEMALKADTDMEPDEFIAPNADTDLPIDHQVMNDAVLRGEGYSENNVENLPPGDKKNKDNQQKKMDAGKT